MLKILTTSMLADYRRIMGGEIALRPQHSPDLAFGTGASVLSVGEEIFHTATQLFEIAEAATVPRVYNSSYNLSTDEFYYESVSAHTNLVSAIATEALDYRYGYEFGTAGQGSTRTADGFSYREVMEVARLHDLTENETGDIANNGARDEEKKRQDELRYLEGYLDTYASEKSNLKLNILKLFRSMQDRSSPTGRLLSLSDRIAALIITLRLDMLGHSPMMMKDSPLASELDRSEMRVSDCPKADAFKASEMWAIDFFEIRKPVEMDRDFFFTALTVMSTLIANGRWYNWREVRYKYV